jgi:hypothetical protein
MQFRQAITTTLLAALAASAPRAAAAGAQPVRIYSPFRGEVQRYHAG